MESVVVVKSDSFRELRILGVPASEAEFVKNQVNSGTDYAG